MTVNQYLTLLSFTVWPITALIAGVAFVHGVRLAIDGLSDYASRVQVARLKETGRMVDFVLNALPTIAEHIRGPQPAQSGVRDVAEQGFIALLQARGGLPIPAPNGDPAVRQLVREVREMYDELEHPTPKPAKGAWAGQGTDPDGADPDSEEAMLQELFGVGAGYGPGAGVGDDIDPEAEPIELPEDM